MLNERLAALFIGKRRIQATKSLYSYNESPRITSKLIIESLIANLISIESMSVCSNDLSEKYLDNICCKIRLFLKICILSYDEEFL